MARKFPFVWKIGILLLLILLAGTRLPTSYAAASPAPILVVTNSAYSTNPFGSYLGEILRAEGLNEFDQTDLSSISSAQLGQYSVVILADTPLTSAQAATFSGYVNAGGRLIAMHPDPQLAAVLGLGSSAGPPQTDGYLKISPTAQINGETTGQGLYTDTMQIHGSVERFTPLTGATVVATLYSDAVTATAYPAVTYNVYGSGQAVAFLYDLAKNVVYTRQGNPANANIDVDGDGVIRTIDLFQKQGGGAGWVDLNKVPVPQADMQQRLFARLIKEMRGVSGPLPQLWYFPNSVKTMLILTGDAHANPTSYFQTEITSINNYHGKITFYIAIGSSPTPSDVLSWLPQGHTFGIHPYANKPDPDPAFNITNLQQGYSVYYNWFQSTYSVSPYFIPMSLTVRNHQVAWAGWTDSADYAAKYGIAMDTSFYDWGPWLKKPDGTWPHGYITGSGQPMKFARSDGSLVPVYQQLTQLIDEQLLGNISPNLENLTPAQAITVSQQMMDASLGGNYAALMTQDHVDYYNFGDPQTWAEGTMSYANSKGVPIWNADNWLNFTQTRHDANISNVVWDPAGGILSYSLAASPSSNYNLTLSVPWNYNGKVLTGALVDNANATVSQQTINGLTVGFINVTAGSHAVSAFYGTPAATLTPTNTPIPPTATSTPTATATNLPPTATPTPTATLTPTATSTGPAPTATATATASATPTATPTGTVTPFPTSTSTPLPAPGFNLVLSSYTDFAPSCTLISGAHVSDAGGGAVSLAAPEADDFTGTVLDTTKWSSGNWNGSAYSPTFGSSVMSIAASGGAWVRSVPTYTHATLEAVAAFGNTPYQHIGYGSDGFSGNRYFLFSTYLGDGNLYARVNNNSTEQNLNLGPIPVGMHHYRIEWSASDASNDRVVFYIDGTQVASFTVTNVGATGFYAYMSNMSATVPLQVDAIQSAPPYTSSGSYVSCIYDAGSTNIWQSVAWDPSVPAGTGASVQVNTSNDTLTWSGWTGVSTASGSALPAPARYVQFQLALNTTNPALTPLINSVTLNAVPTATATPTNTSLPPTPTFTPTATATSTPLPTAANIPLPTATNTPIPTATNTPLPTATDTPLPTATNTPLPTATNTPLPTATNTLLPTSTFTPTPTVVPTLADSIFASSFETGNLSEWTSASTNLGNLSASTTARLVGNYGMQAVINNNNPMSVHDASPASETTYRARFYFSPNSISMGSSDAHLIFTAKSGATTVIRWQFRFNNIGQYQLQGGTLLNNGSLSNTGWFTISNAPHYIELSWVSASTTTSTDGSMQWWIDGQLRATQSGLANGLYRIDDAYLGPQSGIDSTTRGTEFYDAFVSRRFTYIGS